MASGASLPMVRDDMCVGRWRRAPRGVKVASGAPLPVGRGDMCVGRWGRAPGGAAVGAGATLPVGCTDASIRRDARTPGVVEVGSGARCSLRCKDTARVASDAPSAVCRRQPIIDVDMHHLSRLTYSETSTTYTC